MSRFSRAGRDPHDPWFRIGTVDFNTTNTVTLAQVVGLFVVAFEGNFGPMMRQLPMAPDSVFGGQLWRIVTWPFFVWPYNHPKGGFSTVIAIFFFWYFGKELERYLGRVRMLVLFVGSTLLLTVVGLALSPFIEGFLAGISLIELVVFLVFVAENPHARFFFNIPAWLIGAVIVGIQVLGYLANRDWFGMLSFVIGLYFCAILAKSLGLLQDYHQIPAVPNRYNPRTQQARRNRPAKGRGRSHGHGNGHGRGHTTGPTVVAGPWEHLSKDQRELDALLDKISQHGVEALTDKDRARITELRERIRRQG